MSPLLLASRIRVGMLPLVIGVASACFGSQADDREPAELLPLDSPADSITTLLIGMERELFRALQSSDRSRLIRYVQPGYAWKNEHPAAPRKRQPGTSGRIINEVVLSTPLNSEYLSVLAGGALHDFPISLTHFQVQHSAIDVAVVYAGTAQRPFHTRTTWQNGTSGWRALHTWVIPLELGQGPFVREQR